VRFGLDHVFICTSIGGAEADRLVTFGLIEGTPNVHPGQGTACKRFFFHNAYLEMLWVYDSVEAQSELIQPTRLWERWTSRSKAVCPFGFGFRSKSHEASELPFSTWQYHPPYLPPPLSIQVVKNSDVLTEPMLFHLAFAQRPDSYPIAKRQSVEHPCGLREITLFEFVSPQRDKLSPELQAALDADLISLRVGTEYLLELGFDGESHGRKANFRPALPLVFRW
jgi:hypothetical protein